MRKLILISGAMLFCLNIILAQREARQRIPLIGTQAPSFKAPSTNGTISFPEDFGKDWKILFAHPRDFTPVCSSEILELAYRQSEFKELGTQIVVMSVDRMASHRSWKADLEDVSFKGRSKVKIGFPLVVDSSSVISYSYGMVDPQSVNNQSIRGVFFIDPENKIRAFQFYPSEVGRSTDEIMRVLKALQTQYTHQNTIIPANWQPGDDVMVPILTKEDKEDLKSPEPKVHFINWYMIFRKLK
jgi:peroxiredoxin (alkyl hydroperoxide reductase subunit C)